MAEFLRAETAGNRQMQGYWSLHLHAVYATYVISQNTVRQMIKLLDPEVVELRHYQNKSLYMVQHVDFYHKLKPYCTAFIYCMNGFSHHVAWMVVQLQKLTWTISHESTFIGSWHTVILQTFLPAFWLFTWNSISNVSFWFWLYSQHWFFFLMLQFIIENGNKNFIFFSHENQIICCKKSSHCCF